VENIPGHRDHHSDDHDQLIGIISERVIVIIPEPVIGVPGTLTGIVRNPHLRKNNKTPNESTSEARNKNLKTLELRN
jgi:hypothetical protein